MIKKNNEMNKYFVIIATASLFILLTASCGQRASNKQIVPHLLVLSEIPGEAGYMGDIVEAYKYTDSTGDNIVLLTETEVMDVSIDEDTPMFNKGLYAYRFQKKGDAWEEAWRVYHSKDDCPHFPVAQFVKGAFTLTDLNSDGEAEVWLVYVSSCHDNASPNYLYTTMETVNRQYNTYGECLLKLPNGDSMGGGFAFCDNFANATTPPAFLDFAETLREKHIACGGGSGSTNSTNTIQATKPAIVEQSIKIITDNKEVRLGLMGSGTATVDWGDGSAKETLELSEYTAFVREFPDENFRTITVSGKDITVFSCIWGALSVLDVRRNPMLTELSLKVNQLETLDLTQNTALKYVDIKANQFTAAALNELFGTLHSNGGTINIAYNPGTDDCNKSIAEAKGWTVEIVEPEEENDD
jgi:hypothetical protein